MDHVFPCQSEDVLANRLNHLEEDKLPWLGTPEDLMTVIIHGTHTRSQTHTAGC